MGIILLDEIECQDQAVPPCFQKLMSLIDYVMRNSVYKLS